MSFGRRWRALWHDRFQGLLASFAVATAVALPVVLLSVGGGVAEHEIASLEDSGYQITVSAQGQHGVEGSHSLAQRIGEIPGVASASPILSAALEAFPPGLGATPVLAEGVIPTAFTATEGPSERGLFPAPLPFADPTDSIHFADGSYNGPHDLEVLVSTPFAVGEGLTVGDSLWLSPTSNASAGEPFRVSGTFGVPAASLLPVAAFALLLPLSELQGLSELGAGPGPGTNPIDASDSISVGLAPSLSTDAGSIGRVAAQIQPLVPYYSVSSLTDQASQLRSSANVLTGFYWALSSVGLLIGVLFLVLVLLRQVESQRRDEAIRRALGVPPSRLIGRWILSGARLGAGGSVGGVVAGIVLVELLASYGEGAVATAAQLATFEPQTLLEVVGLAVGLGALAGAAAAGRSLRRSITEDLR